MIVFFCIGIGGGGGVWENILREGGENKGMEKEEEEGGEGKSKLKGDNGQEGEEE